MARSKFENKELAHNIRINGRIYAAFRDGGAAEAFAYNIKDTFPAHTVEIVDQYDTTILKLLPRA